MKKRIFVMFGLVLSALACAHADDLVSPARTEVYIGPLLGYNSIGGEFDGDTVYSNGDGVAVVPDLDAGMGIGGVLGVKINRPSGRALALEGSLFASGHDAEFAGGTGDAGLLLLSGDLKLFPVTGGAIEPWLQVGLSRAFLTVEDGFFKSGGGTDDATFDGIGLNLGAGLLTYVTPRLGIHFAAIYRIISYGAVDYDKRAELDDSLSGNTLSLEIGATFRFSRGN